jgi:hypothetical protein
MALALLAVTGGTQAYPHWVTPDDLWRDRLAVLANQGAWLRVLRRQWQGEFCRCSIDVVGGKLVASTMSSAFDTTQAESGQTSGATGC